MTQTADKAQETTQELTPDQIDFYFENGYIGVENVLSASELAEINGVVDEFIERSRTETEDGDVFDLEPGHTADNPQVARIRYPWLQHEVFAKTRLHPAILKMVSQLVGPTIRGHSGKINIKPAKVGTGFEWHQDWAAFPHTNDDILALGICLEDTTLENGCLLVVPGSHKGPIYDHHQDGMFVLATPPDGLMEQAVPIELHAGGISLHHVRTLHASGPNMSNRSRRLMLFEYASGDAWPLNLTLRRTERDPWDSLSEDMVQGELSATPRMEKLPVRLPFPRKVMSGSSIFAAQKTLKKSAFGDRSSM